MIQLTGDDITEKRGPPGDRCMSITGVMERKVATKADSQSLERLSEKTSQVYHSSLLRGPVHMRVRVHAHTHTVCMWPYMLHCWVWSLLIVRRRIEALINKREGSQACFVYDIDRWRDGSLMHWSIQFNYLGQLFISPTEEWDFPDGSLQAIIQSVINDLSSIFTFL